MNGFWLGLIAGLIVMGVLETCVPGIGYHDAMLSKDSCEKSLPRDQVCIAHYLPAQQPTQRAEGE